MNIPSARSLCFYALFTSISCCFTASADDGVIKPFDGTTLESWEGDKSYWSIQDGCIVGQSTAEHPLTQSAYLVWNGDMPRDFVLRCKIKMTGGNSGIHYRSSRKEGQHDLAGFQADFDGNNSYTGVLYEGLGRGLMSARGEQVEFSPAGKRVVAQFAPDEVLRKSIRTGEWNEYRIEACGTRVRHWLNDVLMSDVTDGDASRFRPDGLLGFQLHQGDPMQVRFKDLEVRPIQSAPPAESLTIPTGFSAQLLASAQSGQGSWVCIAFDDKNRALISPQDGALMLAWIPGISRNQDGTLWTGTTTEIQPFSAPIRSSQGFCFLGDVLYANGFGADDRMGLWRLRDLDKNGSFEDATCILPYEGDAGEHGPHAVVKGPDGAIYVALGNHTKVPPSIAQYSNDEKPGRAPNSPCDFFGEDRIDARMWDPRGHAVGVYSPGGVVVRVDPATDNATIFANGFRNAYDHCFNADGELFTYDSDMEWDIGAPWYRAPRIVHVVQGGDYGWRSGSAAMPDWYPDQLPPASETDSASPTGMLAGYGGGFPAPWKNMIFCADWTYGRILAATISPEGSTYRAPWQPFITGRPMPVADMAWGPDGAMYFVTGGRGTQSGLYCVKAEKSAATTVAPATSASASHDAACNQLRLLRRSFERDQHTLGEAELAKRMPALLLGLDHSDRFVQDAARVALEHQPLDSWRDAVGKIPSTRAKLAGALALLRVGGIDDAKSACDIAAKCFAKIPSSTLGDNDAILAIRIAEVAVARHRELASFPSVLRVANLGLDRAAQSTSTDSPAQWIALELASALNLPSTVPMAMAALERAPDRSAALRYVSLLRLVKDGWTDSLRARYWQWLNAANDQGGGFSLAGFIENIRTDARATVGEQTSNTATAAAPITTPFLTTNATLHDWKVSEFEDQLDSSADSQSRDIARGARIFRESTCILCHRFANEGSSTGPDLTGAGGRFTNRDLLSAILDPSIVVSDQYKDSIIETKSGTIVVGRIVSDSAEAIEVRPNPLTFDRERVLKSDIQSIAQISTSSMPSGLLNSRSRDEILDLLAYLRSQTSATNAN